MSKKSITIYDVAHEAGVSMATVSRVVNGNPNVKKTTREKVQAVIKKLNYTPNAVARGLASNRTTTIGVMVPNITNLYYATLALGIDDVATMYDYNVIIENSIKAIESEASVLYGLFSKQVDGVIYMGHQFDDELRDVFKQFDKPVVLAGSIDPKDEFASVNIDYKESMQHVTGRLLENNERVAYVAQDLSYTIDGGPRLEGFKAAYKARNIPSPQELILESGYHYEQGQRIAEELIALKVEAVVVTHDEVAVVVMNSLIEKGYKIPEDFKIYTCHDTKVTQFARPKLSAIEEPLYDVGAVSMRLLTKLMLKEEVTEKQVVLPHHYADRGSSESF